NGFLANIISPAISLFGIILPVIGLILSLMIIQKQRNPNRFSKTISILAVLIYSGIFLTTLVIWRMNIFLLP
ncbi:MAG: hypothetical protein DRJ05_12640, partial [Bacteroidetes bacterium]